MAHLANHAEGSRPPGATLDEWFELCVRSVLQPCTQPLPSQLQRPTMQCEVEWKMPSINAGSNESGGEVVVARHRYECAA